MTALPAQQVQEQAPPAGADAALLERRIARERAARKSAEALLNSKSLELYDALQQTSEAQRQLELALWASGESIWEWNAENNGITIRTFSTADGEPKTTTLSFDTCIARIKPEDTEQATLIWRMHLMGNTDAIDMSVRFLSAQNWHWFRIRGQAVLRDAQGWAQRTVGTVKDVTQHRAAEESLRLMASAFASSRDAMLVLTEQWQIIEANGAFSELSGTRAQQLMGESFTRFLDLPASMLQRLQQSGHFRAEGMLQAATGKAIPIEIGISRFAASDGSAPYLIATLRDITERKEAAQALEQMAKQDALTQLPNRNALQETLDELLTGISKDKPAAILFIDLDGFKSINDSLGHQAGDELLKVAAGRALALLAPGDQLTRWGGDEFVAVLTQASSIDRIDEFAARLLDEMRMPLDVGGHQVSVSASIGIALAPRDGADAGTLLRRADSAMYAAKNAGRDRSEHYRPELDNDALRRITLTSLLRQAVDRKLLSFVAQPKVRADGRIVGCELLVRWTTQEFGPVSPAAFIPLAEEIGVILAIGHQAIREAAQLARRLKDGGLATTVAVNLSPLQAHDPELETVLLSACRAAQIHPGRIQLELTESTFLDNKKAIFELLHKLKAHGFTLALDDFGTGYSSLSYLRDLPFDVIKIDRAFLRNIDLDQRSMQLLAGIVDLCAALGMGTVAEGVETASQLAVLSRLGIGEYQGFYFHRPMPQDEFVLLATLRQLVETT
ncbi:putative bifunctional diguanylate cyclase/phosphodiesterase [Undibacterium arcticum]|uniref:Bifunctional diguanylate cyclase/phosphodiesterase n=1 Tax=Undibacterium arcticum TaxID=1762892 RepID=A0ABV7F2I9_9BURK